MSKSFFGFNNGTEIVPTQFFEELLPTISDLCELKVTLFSIYLLNQFEGSQRYLIREDFSEEETFMNGLSEDIQQASKQLDEGLAASVERGTLLSIRYDNKPLYFLNSPKGRTALNNLQQGTWIPDAFLHLKEKANLFRPNIYQLYEENIGPLTPMIADILRDSETIYSYEWIADAVEIAVVNNVRNWRYIETILKSWKENGRDGVSR